MIVEKVPTNPFRRNKAAEKPRLSLVIRVQRNSRSRADTPTPRGGAYATDYSTFTLPWPISFRAFRVSKINGQNLATIA